MSPMPIGIDVSLKSHHVQFIDGAGTSLASLAVPKDQSGADTLIQKMLDTASKKQAQELRIGMEATSNLGWHLAHIVHLILQPFIIRGKSRREQMIRPLCSVQIEAIQSFDREAGSRTYESLLHRELLSNIGSRFIGVDVYILLRFDPLRLPIRNAQKTGFEESRPAELQLFFMIAPYLDTPIIAFERFLIPGPRTG